MSSAKVSDYRNKLEQLKGKRDKLQSDISKSSSILKKEESRCRDIEKAQVIIQEVAQQTQQELVFHISDLVTSALYSIFEDKYRFKLDFVVKRNKTEAEMFLETADEGDKVDPMNDTGGGVVDITAFALRVALWSLKPNRSRNVIVLDEPFRFLSRDLQPKASAMLKMLSEKIGLQFIIVTHSPDLIESADRIFEVKFKKGVSHVNRKEEIQAPRQNTINRKAKHLGS